MIAKPIHCPVTGEPARFYRKKGNASYYIAPAAGVIFQAEAPGRAAMATFAEAEYQSGLYREYAEARDIKLRTNRWRLSVIAGHVHGGRLLDLGCSAGFFLEVAQAAGFDVTGIEWSPAARAKAQPAVRDRILVGDIEQTLLQPELGKFDVVTAFDVIEHVPDPAALVALIRKVLKPGGLLVLTTPDTGHWLRYAMGGSWPMLQPSQHLVLFSRRAMDRLLGAAGLEPDLLRSARKVFTLRYLFGQLRALTPAIWKTYRVLARFVPGRLLDAEFTANIGEFLVIARSKGD